MKLALALFSTFALSLAVAGCPPASGDDDDANACSNTVTEWTCENGSCTCDDDGASCTDPEETTADDAQNCDNACEECVD